MNQQILTGILRNPNSVTPRTNSLCFVRRDLQMLTTEDNRYRSCVELEATLLRFEVDMKSGLQELPGPKRKH